jgi:hypothetical protein
LLKSVTLRKIVKKNKYWLLRIYKMVTMNKTIPIIAAIGFVLLAVWMSGCFGEDHSTASIVDISRNPSKYINTTVTIKGYYAGAEEGFWGPVYTIRDSSGNSILAELSEGVSDSILVQDNEFYWTGKVVQDEEVIKLIISDIQLV